jgi:ATP-dependent Lon protease
MPLSVPLIPLKNTVVLPDVVFPVFVGRTKSVNAYKAAMKMGAQIVLVLQRRIVDDVSLEDVYPVGVLATIVQDQTIDDKTIKLLVEGQKSFRIDRLDVGPEFDVVSGEALDFVESLSVAQIKVLRTTIKQELEMLISRSQNIPASVLKEIMKQKELGQLVHTITHFLMFPLEDKQRILEATTLSDKATCLIEIIRREVEVLQVEDKLHSTIKGKMEQTQREFYLKEKIKAIQVELGGVSDDTDEIVSYETRLNVLPLSERAREQVNQEIRKLRKLSGFSSEAGVIKSWLEWILDLPWEPVKPVNVDLDKARDTLDSHHFGLLKVKERILEFLAVYKLTQDIQGSILCLVGPSGVGKTSIARSIADVLGRPFVNIALGGMNDEAELRGHRRTYVGAMPGRIIQAMRTAKSRSPVILLDEIDKLTHQFQHNPAAVMLEILDKEQNKSFHDYYLEVPFDVSDALFIATANSVADIPLPLLDRMELIELSGYTLDEKIEIARTYLVPRVTQQNGLSENQISFDDSQLKWLIQTYTREAGLRDLERVLAMVARKLAVELLLTTHVPVLTEELLRQWLGAARVKPTIAPVSPAVGYAMGLAYTQSGGTIMPIEAKAYYGKGQVIMTGKMGEVMQESAQTAMSYVRSMAKRLGLPKRFHEEFDVHLHIPDNAVPKEGPSAGVAMTVALLSAFSKSPVTPRVAMTGEISLYGRVLPVGGVREKLLAAEREGIRTVLVPIDNLDDVEDVKKVLKEPMTIIGIRTLEDVWAHVFPKTPFIKQKLWLDEV